MRQIVNVVTGAISTASELPPATLANNVPETLTKLQIKREAEARDPALWGAMKAYVAADADRQEEWDLAREVNVQGAVMVAAVAALLTPLGITREDFARSAAQR